MAESSSPSVCSFVRNWREFCGRSVVRPGFEQTACRSLRESFDNFARERSQELEHLLDESDRQLGPSFADPLRSPGMVLSLLDGRREELYSLLLKWLLEQLPPQGVVEVLNLEGKSNSGVELELICEVPTGAERDGRLDLVISQGGSWIAVVETKTRQHRPEDLRKHKRYALDPQARQAELVFVAKRNEGYELGGFRFLGWRDVAIGLRRQAPHLIREKDYMTAAVYLASIRAIESNLLGYDSQNIDTAPVMVEHLKDALMRKGAE